MAAIAAAITRLIISLKLSQPQQLLNSEMNSLPALPKRKELISVLKKTPLSHRGGVFCFVNAEQQRGNEKASNLLEALKQIM